MPGIAYTREILADAARGSRSVSAVLGAWFANDWGGHAHIKGRLTHFQIDASLTDRGRAPIVALDIAVVRYASLLNERLVMRDPSVGSGQHPAGA